jgi:hypothetical protein
VICELINKILGKRKKTEITQNNINSEQNANKNDWIVEKIQKYSLSVLLGESRAINIIAIQCSECKNDEIVNLDDAESFFKKKFGKKIIYTNSYIPHHFLITNNGEIFETSPLSVPALSVSGHFNDGLSICYVGGIDGTGKSSEKMTAEQNKSVTWLVNELKKHLGVNSVFFDN